MYFTFNLFFLYFILLGCLTSCNSNKDVKAKKLKVIATAYNSVYWQTKRKAPSIAAWGDTLLPGMKVIAVSIDLIDSGLTYNTKVFIEELADTFIVKDKMNKRWRNKIDIYMGQDIQQAKEFGRRELNISWVPQKNNLHRLQVTPVLSQIEWLYRQFL